MIHNCGRSSALTAVFDSLYAASTESTCGQGTGFSRMISRALLIDTPTLPEPFAQALSTKAA